MGVIRDRARRSTPGWFHVRGGTIAFGTALTAGGKGDVLLSRTALDTLTVEAGDTFSVGGTVLITSGAGGGSILWGAELNLYRRNAGTLITDNAFVASEGLVTKEATGAIAAAALDANGAIQVQVCGGTSRLVFHATGTTYYIDATG